MKPILYFVVEVEDGFLNDSDNDIPNEIIIDAVYSAKAILPRTPISPTTTSFFFNNDSGGFHCLAIEIEGCCVAYSIRDEKIRILAVKNKPRGF
jgi:hypothetical protein